jgi:hypothetical protein
MLPAASGEVVVKVIVLLASVTEAGVTCGPVAAGVGALT